MQLSSAKCANSLSPNPSMCNAKKCQNKTIPFDASMLPLILYSV